MPVTAVRIVNPPDDWTMFPEDTLLIRASYSKEDPFTPPVSLAIALSPPGISLVTFSNADPDVEYEYAYKPEDHGSPYGLHDLYAYTTGGGGGSIESATVVVQVKRHPAEGLFVVYRDIDGRREYLKSDGTWTSSEADAWKKGTREAMLTEAANYAGAMVGTTDGAFRGATKP